MKRLFLILLVLTLILLSAAVQGAANAFPDGEEKFLGLIPYWDLRLAIPCGIFAAGELMAAMGVGAQLILSVRRLAGKGDREESRHLQQLLLCSLWCGWTIIACCTTGLGYIIPGIGTPAAYSMGFYTYFAIIGAAAMLVCHALNAFLRGRLSVIPGLLALAFGVAAGYVWHNDYMAFLVLTCFMGVAGLSIRRLVALWPEGKLYIIPAAVGLVVAAADVLELTARRGREVDAAMVATLCITLLLAAGLSVARLAK